MADDDRAEVRFVADRSVRLTDGGRTLIGGSPLQVLRFSAPIDLDDIRSATVADRLVTAGILHPVHAHGPFTARDVTVVVPVFDAPTSLGDTLDGLVVCGDDVEGIIVVDDASADRGAIDDVVTGVADDRIRVVRRAHNGGPGAARNTGLDEVATPLVAFLDAGCVPEPGWLDPLLTHFADPRVATVAPRVVADPSHTTTYRAAPRRTRDRVGAWVARRVACAIRSYEARRSSLDLGAEPGRVAPRTRVAYVPSACLVCRTDVLRTVGGFDERLRVGEDVDLVWRIAAEHRIRYEPAGRVRHDIRSRPVAWLRRRFDYGTSAAPLALRHPGEVPPVSLSRWSLAAWVAVAAGRPGAGMGIVALSAALLTRKLSGLEHPVPEGCRLAGLGNLAAGRLLADALRRPWWPAAVLVALFGPRPARRLVAVAFLAPLIEWRPAIGVDPLTWLALRIADDVAYGTGVLAGCVDQRTIAPLLPDLGAGRFPGPGTTG